MKRILSGMAVACLVVAVVAGCRGGGTNLQRQGCSRSNGDRQGTEYGRCAEGHYSRQEPD